MSAVREYERRANYFTNKLQKLDPILAQPVLNLLCPEIRFLGRRKNN